MHEYLRLAHTALNEGRFQQALDHSQRLIIVHPEVGAAHMLLGTTHLALEQYDEAVTALEQATRLDPTHATAWQRLGIAHFHRKDMEAAEGALGQAWTRNPSSAEPLAWLAKVYLMQQDAPKAVDMVKRAMELNPNHPEVIYVFGLMSARLDEVKGVEAAIRLLEQGGLEGARLDLLRRHRDRMRLETGPPARSSRAPMPAVAPDAEQRVWGRNEITIVCGRTPHQWSPQALESGIGGSEEAVIRLARSLTRLGWKVTVYNSVGSEGGRYDGVVYESFERFNPKDAFNILVGWRNVRLFDRPYHARSTYLWLHDLPNPMSYTAQRLRNIDKVIVLSRFHRSCLPNVPDSKFMISSNGIDVSGIRQWERRGIRPNPHRCIYASSYDRGLEVLLGQWGEVVRAVPDAELHVFYGWQGFSQVAAEPSFQAWKTKMEWLMTQPGVVHHGRVSQDQIMLETALSGLWTYPATFAETSCITAMKAQAAGAIPVILNYAALGETVRYGKALPTAADGACSPETAVQYRNQLIVALRDQAWQADIRPEMKAWAQKRFSWLSVAHQWHNAFLKQSEAVRRALRAA